MKKTIATHMMLPCLPGMKGYEDPQGYGQISKSEYVRSEVRKGHDGTHKCHAARCKRMISPAYFMCGTHWSMVPTEIQARIWKHYRKGQERDKNPSKEYLEASRDAILAVARAEGIDWQKGD